ncbi:hypothetical protein BDP67DRAFT_285984 [Colletotrichum lupini]|nr:hypothetical protein BDP67DRAFT_285984 [Colletotrichum lupini]
MKRRLVSCLHSVASLQAYGVQAAKISQSQETNAALGHKKLHPRFIPNYPPSPLHLLHAAPILCDTLQRVYQGLSALDCHLIGAWPVLGPFLGTWTTHGSPFHLWPDLGLELFALLLLFGRLRIHAKLPDLAPAVYPYTSKRHRRSTKKSLKRLRSTEATLGGFLCREHSSLFSVLSSLGHFPLPSLHLLVGPRHPPGPTPQKARGLLQRTGMAMPWLAGARVTGSGRAGWDLPDPLSPPSARSPFAF